MGLERRLIVALALRGISSPLQPNERPRSAHVHEGHAVVVDTINQP
jgi:hypothetical protein